MRVSFAALAVLLITCATSFGSEIKRDMRREQRIDEELAAVAPRSVDKFRKATDAMDHGDFPQAVQLYGDVLQQAPSFTPALRRLGSCLAEEGQVDEALPLLEKAVQVQRSAENLGSLARVLAYPGPGKVGTPSQKERALKLAEEASAANQDSEDPSYLLLVAEIALALERETEFQNSVQLLLQRFPNSASAHYMNAVRLALAAKWMAAEDEIKKAQSLGLPAAAVEQFLDSGVRTRARIWRWSRFCLYALAAWALGLLILYAAGKLFSRITLRLLEQSDPNVPVSRSETRLRHAYRSFISIAGYYYYVSLPFVILLVVGVTSLVVYGFFQVGEVPIKLVALLVIGAAVTVYKMVHSLFVKISSQDPGRSLTHDEAPGLWTVAREVADSLGTRPLDDIRIVPGTDMAVYERGTFRERRQDRGRRILVMGVGLLDGFAQNPFRAVLAHEYGHLSHRDTAGGDIALRVNQDMLKFAHAMARAGQAVWWNIAFHFLRLYHFLFRRISHGATRLQEVLADRASARLYGAQPFEEGLRHVIRRQIEFDHFANKAVQHALDSGGPLENLYQLQTNDPSQDIQGAIETAVNRSTSEDDTHPSPEDRFRLVRRVACPNQLGPDGKMWDLFLDREALTQEMNAEVAKMLNRASTGP